MTREELREKVARAIKDARKIPRHVERGHDPFTPEADAAIALCMEEAANPAFLRPLVEEQSKGEWDDKTIDEDVAMYSAAIRALGKEGK